MITKFITNVASVVYPVLATPNFLAYIRKQKEAKKLGVISHKYSRYLERLSKREDFFLTSGVALLAPIPVSFLREKMSYLTQHVYSMICKTKWQNTVLSIPFMKNKLKKDLFHKINRMGEKIKMNEQGRKGNQDNK